MKKADLVKFWPGHPLSYTTTKIDTYYGGQYISSATGFVLRIGDKYGLVTNWHVLSGRHPETGSCLSKYASIPDRIEFHVTVSVKKIVDKKERETLYFKPMKTNLFARGRNKWFDEKDNNNQNDYAIIPISKNIPELKKEGSSLRAIGGGKITLKKDVVKASGRSDVVPIDSAQHFYPKVGSEVFILGYPRGIDKSGVFPIWKRASIASEPQASITLSGKETDDVFFVDAMTKTGMSGSPAIYMGRKGDILFAEDGLIVEWQDDAPILVGVYAGREGVTQDEYELSLGRVWKAAAVEKLFFKNFSYL